MSVDDEDQLAETDLAAQARSTAAIVARGAQTGAKNAADGFNRFVEGNNSSGGYRDVPIDESKKDFWDSFAEAGSARQQGAMGGFGMGGGASAVGTSAIKKAGGGGGGAGGGMGGGGKKDDEWDKW